MRGAAVSFPSVAPPPFVPAAPAFPLPIFRDSGGSLAPPPWPWRGRYDKLFWDAAKNETLLAAWLKAIAQHESGQGAMRINPEDSRISERELRNKIVAANDGGISFLASFNPPINPSTGLLQIRWSTAKALGAGSPASLFDPPVNVAIGALLAYQMRYNQGIDIFSLPDVWNVGAGGNWFRGVRNVAYRNAVLGWFRQFQADFPPNGANVS